MRKMLLIALLVLVLPMNARAEMRKMTCTSYTATGNKTAYGTIPHDGIVAGSRELKGKTVAIYKRDAQNGDALGEFVGWYVVEDFGHGHNNAIEKGYVLDIFCEGETIPTFKAWVQVIDAQG